MQRHWVFCRNDEKLDIHAKCHKPANGFQTLDGGEFESILDKRALIRRALRAIKMLSADVDKIARKKIDFDFGLGTFLVKLLSSIYKVLKKYATKYHHEPFDTFKFWAHEKFTPNVIELRKSEIALYLASIQQACWQLEFKYIIDCVDIGSLNLFIRLTGRCREVLEKFFIKFNPRGLKELWKVPSYSDGSNVWLL